MDCFDANVVLGALWFAGAVRCVIQTTDEPTGCRSAHTDMHSKPTGE